MAKKHLHPARKARWLAGCVGSSTFVLATSSIAYYQTQSNAAAAGDWVTSSTQGAVAAQYQAPLGVADLNLAGGAAAIGSSVDIPPLREAPSTSVEQTPVAPPEIEVSAAPAPATSSPVSNSAATSSAPATPTAPATSAPPLTVAPAPATSPPVSIAPATPATSAADPKPKLTPRVAARQPSPQPPISGAS